MHDGSLGYNYPSEILEGGGSIFQSEVVKHFYKIAMENSLLKQDKCFHQSNMASFVSNWRTWPTAMKIVEI